ncbi:hypothetical protein KJ975_09580 [Myxococcota bacterium]|nr:hypothetical protein [Myxococcota bacterium]
MSGQHRDWEAILQRVYSARKAAADNAGGVSLQDIVSMATGRTRIPGDLDADLREFVDTVAEWENYDWKEQAASSSPFDVLVCWVHKQVQVVMSSLTWQPAVVAGVRGENGAELVGVRTVTADGAHLELSPDLHGGARLNLSFPAPATVPARVELKRDGTLLDSAPEDHGAFHFDLPESGVYALELCYPDRTVGFLALALEPREQDPA